MVFLDFSLLLPAFSLGVVGNGSPTVIVTLSFSPSVRFTTGDGIAGLRSTRSEEYVLTL